jgi:glycine oxidase
VIGPSSVVPGLHWAVGHRRGGILLAPVTAELVCASVAGAPADPLAARFDPARYQRTEAGSPA